jgi:DNA (cytosine-5)-methyltransferase 1
MEIYFNEIEKFPAQWIKNLAQEGIINIGSIVDERSITEVLPDELEGFQRCHFFAGVAGWEIALQQAGWPKDVPVWTGSCPCQPFSAAGKGRGTADERHLWPEFLRLIATCRPPHIFGEQVSGKKVTGKLYTQRVWERLEQEDRRAAEEADREAWFRHVQTDLERIGYIVGHCVFPAASVGAPHARQRLYWYARYVCDTYNSIRKRDPREIYRKKKGVCSKGQQDGNMPFRSESSGSINPLGDSKGGGRGEERPHQRGLRTRAETSQHETRGSGAECSTCDVAHGNHEHKRSARNASGPANLGWKCEVERMANNSSEGLAGREEQSTWEERPSAERDGGTSCGMADTTSIGRKNGSEEPGKSIGVVQQSQKRVVSTNNRRSYPPGPTNGHWRAADWIYCRDDKWRPVEPGSSPLADGVSAKSPGGRTELARMARASRKGQLAGYGNAIVIPQAVEFIRACMEEL